MAAIEVTKTPLYKRWVRSLKLIRALEDGPDLTVEQCYFSTRLYAQVIEYVRVDKKVKEDPDMHAIFLEKKEAAPGYRR